MLYDTSELVDEMVALFTRAWIEMLAAKAEGGHIPVALFTRAWIEIICISLISENNLSPSSRGRGLK